MKLGTETGSLTNHIMSRAVIGQPTAAIGMGATVLCWTDRHAGTIQRVDSWARAGKAVTHVAVQEDWSFRTDKNGMSECQDYSYQPNPTGSWTYFQSTDGGAWQEMVKSTKTNRWNKVKGGKGLRIGERDTYHDYSF